MNAEPIKTPPHWDKMQFGEKLIWLFEYQKLQKEREM